MKERKYVESFGHWTQRVWRECADKMGRDAHFYVWCLTNYPDILTEYHHHDTMMRDGYIEVDDADGKK